MLLSSDNVAVIRKAELTKKIDTQTQSPSKRTVIKPSARQTRPTQHHSCPRRRPTGDTLPWSHTSGAFCRRATRAPAPTTSYLCCQLHFGFGIHFVLSVTIVFFSVCHVCFFVFDHNKKWTSIHVSFGFICFFFVIVHSYLLFVLLRAT